MTQNTEEKSVKINQRLDLQEINNSYDSCFFEDVKIADDQSYNLDWHHAEPRSVKDAWDILSKHKPVFKNCNFKNLEWKADQPVELVLENCVVNNSVVNNAQFFDSEIKNCVFKNTKFAPKLAFGRDGNYHAQSSVKNSTFIDCDLKNFPIHEGKIENNIFENCENDYFNFYKTIIKNDFKNMNFNFTFFCNLTVENHFENVVFYFCDLENVDFSKSTFINCDFRSCQTYKNLIFPREYQSDIKLTKYQRETIVFL